MVLASADIFTTPVWEIKGLFHIEKDRGLDIPITSPGVALVFVCLVLYASACVSPSYIMVPKK